MGHYMAERRRFRPRIHQGSSEIRGLDAILLDSRTSEPAAVSAVESTFFEGERWLDFHDAELSDAASLFDYHVTGGIDRHFPPVVRTAVAGIHHAHGIRLQDAEVPERGTARGDMRLVTLGQLHCNAQMNQAELPRLERHGLRRSQVNPVGLAANVSEFRDGIVEILNLDGLRGHGANIKSNKLTENTI